MGAHIKPNRGKVRKIIFKNGSVLEFAEGLEESEKLRGCDSLELLFWPDSPRADVLAFGNRGKNVGKNRQ